MPEIGALLLSPTRARWRVPWASRFTSLCLLFGLEMVLCEVGGERQVW